MLEITICKKELTLVSFNDAGQDKSELFEMKFSIMFPLRPRLLHH